MQNSLFPTEIIGHTSEKILLRHTARGHIIYCTIVAAALVTFALLPILKVTISIQSPGIIRPKTEKIEISSTVSGTVKEIFVKENQSVKKGQLILKIDQTIIDEKLRLKKYLANEKREFIHDLELMISFWENRQKVIQQLKTMHYKNEYIYFSNQLTNNHYTYEKAAKEAERNKLLYKGKLVSLSDLEYKELDASQLKIQYDMLIQNQLELWNKDLLSNKINLKELKLQQEQFEMEKDYYTVKAPINGTIEQFSGIVVSSFLQSGKAVAIISPTADLVGETYVSPRDIGMLSVGTKTNIQVDAFNHNQWGLISGKISEISNDFIMMNDNPVFRIRCTLDQGYLQLKNGLKGNLKKGMTVRNRFLITKVSLLQLLYQDIDEWLNPFTE